jgi:tRNA dimethylallyltransferase
MPELDEVRRAELAVTLDALSRGDLRSWCASLDPSIARLGPVQWRRAVEVALLTGRRLSDWHADAPRSPRVAARYLVLDPGEALDDLIAARVDAMLGAGWVAEVESLMVRVPEAAIAWKACGYERLRAALAAGEPLGAAREDIVKETRRYARRQRTWFRTQLRHGAVTRLDPRDAGALDRACTWWQGANGE